ncbi:2-dehydropantoate 2-reductase [Bacillaceae bacterium W0354]
MDIGVIGLGAVGMLVTSELSIKHNVTCYVRRKEQKDLINAKGILYNSQQVIVKANLIDELTNHELIIVCVKQTQLDDVLIHLRKLNKPTLILFLQNGLGHIEKVNTLPHHVFVGTNENGVLRKSDHAVTRTGKGIIRLSSLDIEDRPHEARLIDELNQQHFTVEKSDQLMQILHEKLVINSVINPLTALFNVKNGEVINNIYIRKIAHRLTKEACEVVSLNSIQMWDRVQAVAKNTKDNYSSMAIDLQQGNETEIDYINGYLLKKSKLIQAHQMIYDLVKGKESIQLCKF